jgi:hypothetical protein
LSFRIDANHGASDHTLEIRVADFPAVLEEMAKAMRAAVDTDE